MAHRISSLMVAFLLFAGLLPIIAGGQVASAQETDDSEMRMHDLAHTGFTSSKGPVENNLIWTYETGLTYSSPAIVDGVLYIGSGLGVDAINAIHGDLIWHHDIGNYVDSSPAVANGIVYFGSWNGNVYALNGENGDKIWSYATGGAIETSSPAVAGGIVYIGSMDGKLYALDAENGEKIWDYPTGGKIVGSSPAVVGGKVYIGSYDRKVYALDALTGSQIWKYSTGSYVVSSPTVVNGVVYIGSEDGKVYALDAEDGSKLWKYATGKAISYSIPAVANGVVYIGSSNGFFYALDATNGEKIWDYPTGDWMMDTSAVVSSNGVVYFGTGDRYPEPNKIYALDAETGEKIWDYSTGDYGITTFSPAIADEVLYFTCNNGTLYAFFDPPQPDPNFGYEEIGALGEYDYDLMGGSWFTCPESGTADSISVYSAFGLNYETFKCAIYKRSDGSLVGETEEIKDDRVAGWWTLNFTEPKPVLSNTDYWLLFWQSCYNPEICYDDSEAGKGHSTTGYAYGDWPDSITITETARIYSIYCTYTAEAAAPGKPVLVSPENQHSTSDNTPTFIWTGGSDADNHRIEVDDDPDFSSVIDNVVVDITDNSWTKPSPGYAVDKYWWRVWAVNAQGETCSENTWTFEITAIQPPSKPDLIKPIENQPYFEWSCEGADNYRLLVDNNLDFSTPAEDRILIENYYQIPPENSLDNGVYYWKVIAYNPEGENASDVWSFVVGIEDDPENLGAHPPIRVDYNDYGLSYAAFFTLLAIGAVFIASAARRNHGGES